MDEMLAEKHLFVDGNGNVGFCAIVVNGIEHIGEFGDFLLFGHISE